MLWLDETSAAVRRMRPSFLLGLVVVGALLAACSVSSEYPLARGWHVVLE